MKASIDKDGYLKLDAQTLIQMMPDDVKRAVAKYALFDELLLTGILQALVLGTMWHEDEEGPWWFGGDTFTKLRLQLLPLLPAITAEAVRHLEAEMRAARTERDRWRDACWKLQRSWPRERGQALPSVEVEYEYRRPMTAEQAAEYLRGVEKMLAEAKEPKSNG